MFINLYLKFKLSNHHKNNTKIKIINLSIILLNSLFLLKQLSHHLIQHMNKYNYHVLFPFQQLSLNLVPHIYISQ